MSLSLGTRLARARPCLACQHSLSRTYAFVQPISPLLSSKHIQSRNASHASQGRANGAKDGPGKRLGCKKTQGEYVIPGNIIFRQRGTKWFPGDNVGLGKDHTIFATSPGYVRFYRDPARHPDRKYIGVVLRAKDTLPKPVNAPLRRLLGRYAVQMTQSTSALQVEDGEADASESVHTERKSMPTSKGSGKVELPPVTSLLAMRPGYQYRIANWEIGRAAERKGIHVEPYDPKDRFKAWRKRSARKARAAEIRGARRREKK